MTNDTPLALAPKRTAIYLNPGVMMVKPGKNAQAIPYYERYLHLFPSYKKADELRAVITVLGENAR